MEIGGQKTGVVVRTMEKKEENFLKEEELVAAASLLEFQVFGSLCFVSTSDKHKSKEDPTSQIPLVYYVLQQKRILYLASAFFLDLRLEQRAT